MKRLLLFLLFISPLAYGQRLSYSFGSKAPDGSLSMVLVVSNGQPVEGLIPRIVTALKERGHPLVLSKEEINLTGVTLSNSPFAPEIRYALKFNVRNRDFGEALVQMDLQFYNLETGAVKGTSISHPRENINMIASEIARFIEGNTPKEEAAKAGPQVTGVSGSEASFPLEAYPDLRVGDELFVRFPEARQGLLEIKVLVKRIEIATNSEGAFEKMIVIGNREQLISAGDRIIKNQPQRNRVSFSIMGAASLARTGLIQGTLDGGTLTGARLWGGGFLIQGEFERFLPLGFTSTTALGLTVDGLIYTFVMTGVGWRWIRPQWELIPSLRLGLSFAPVAFSGAAQIQGAVLRFGMDFGLSFLYHIGPVFSLGFDVGLQYWFYSFAVVYRDSVQVHPSFEGGNIPVPYLYPRLGLKFSWKF